MIGSPRPARPSFPITWLWAGACCLLVVAAGSASAAPPREEPTAPLTKELAWKLVARHANEAERLVGSPFGRPIALASRAKNGVAQGEAIAEVNIGFPKLRAALAQPQRWCEILMLAPSIAGCASIDGGIDSRFEVKVLDRYDQSDDDASRAIFRFERGLSDTRYLALQLTAPVGPWGTRDYRLNVEATPLEDGKSLLRVDYSYHFGIRAATALGFYFATSGRDKLGFSQNSQGRPVGGLRGSLERNVMRFFLAIESHLLENAADPSKRFEDSLARWLLAVDHYPERLAEDDPERYRRIKIAQFGTTR